ncbi:DUF418 domain-containing protein [Maritalea mediterranea]|uniref:Heparan-alpha-glucosaminide N-acetyltransferase domain-containing protein n=1 Tax=Maritalea mediterranea TaxID=2909667 RepID=A0ABS9E9X6_9HYPH|nr:heparan-alpha-glucosaminide N-acetyltransferase domain-containing protein [Maritalea mediterranea]MCF4099687.1 heparan-alpha-glucosaminide N-acetyltransferase domain-containing protein [Maritalea mediterranea]
MSGRLDGLDLARLFAFIGMVVVNFNLVMGAPIAGNAMALGVAQGLEGRAAASFVVLAGVGLGLAFRERVNYALLFKRAAFLFGIGMINLLIFPADIIHYYAIYFLFAAWLLTLNNKSLWWAIIGINLVFLAGLLLLDYDAGWNWITFDYVDFWTFEGFVRNLMFNGWHPVLPWLSFLAFGIWLSRQKLGEVRVQGVMVAGGLIVYLANHFGANLVQQAVTNSELALLFGTAPVPPTPLYMLAGASGASVLIGACLLLAPLLQKIRLLPVLLPAGRQTLTLYMAHILIGMGTLEALDMLSGQTIEAVWLASLTFCGAAIMFAYFWAQNFKRGPLEFTMRKICG